MNRLILNMARVITSRGSTTLLRLVVIVWAVAPHVLVTCFQFNFYFGWDFPTAGEICGVFGENDPQKVKISKNTWLEGTSLRQTTSFELSCVEIGSRVWAVRVARKEKIIIIQCTRPWFSPLRAGATAHTITTKFGRVVDPRDVITLAKFENKRFIIVTLVCGRILPF